MFKVETNPHWGPRYTPRSYPPQLQQPTGSRPHPDPPPPAPYPQENLGPGGHYPINQLPPQGSTEPVQPSLPNQTPDPRKQPQHVRTPQPRKTAAHTWLIGVICGLFWISVIVGGLVILIVYLLFRPRSPKFDIAQASLNAAYLDMGYLLNADMTMLVNLTNPSKKATVDFSYIAVTLLYESTPIATSYVEPFLALKSVTSFRNVHLVSSQVWLSSRDSQMLMQQIYNNIIRFEVKSELRTTSKLGGIFRYSYWLYGHCIIEVTGPPTGALLAKRCTTKR